MSSIWDSIGRGAAQGATFNLGDELGAKILDALPFDDGTGIPREYAAGSAEQDYLNTERQANAAAREANPGLYAASEFAGALPASLAVPAGGSIPAAGLIGGAMGAVRGAGAADGGDMVDSAARGAGVGAALGAGGAALPAIKNAALSVLDDIGSSGSGLAPAMATVGSGAAGRAAAPRALPSGAQISRAAAIPPPPRGSLPPEAMNAPRAPKPLVPEKAIDATEDFADVSYVANTAKDNQRLTNSQIDAYRRARAEFEKKQQPSRQPVSSDKGTVKPPRRAARQQAAAPQAGGTPTVPAPVKSLPPAAVRPPTQTVPAPPPQGTPSMRPTMPAPASEAMTPSMRPTMMDFAPVRPTLRPESKEEYMDAVLDAISVPPPRGR